MWAVISAVLGAVLVWGGEFGVHVARAHIVQDRIELTSCRAEIKRLTAPLALDVYVYTVHTMPTRTPIEPCWTLELEDVRLTNRSTDLMGLDFSVSIGLKESKYPERYDIGERYLHWLNPDRPPRSSHLRGPLNLPPKESRGGTIAFLLLPSNIALPGLPVVMNLTDILLTVTDHVTGKTLTTSLPPSLVPETLEIRHPKDLERPRLSKPDSTDPPPSLA
jgi:hypothetical protein